MITSKIRVDCIGKMDKREEAWKVSRPGFSEIDFSEIRKMDLSLNSMCVYTFRIQSSVFFRDLLFSMRPIHPWARSTRSMKINRETIRLSEEFEGNKEAENSLDLFFSAIVDKPIDSCRDLLPMGLSCVYTVTLDYRVLISFIKTLIELDKTIEDSAKSMVTLYVGKLIDAANISMEELDNSRIYNSIDHVNITKDERINGTQYCGSMINGNFKMKLALSSQFLRQHYSTVKTDLFLHIPKYGIENLMQYDVIDTVFYTTVQSYIKLMKNRTHWIADFSRGMWGDIVDVYLDGVTTKEFWEFILCGKDGDPFYIESYNRVTRDDPGIPCPLLCECREFIELRRDEIGDSIVLDKYEALFEEGFVKDNPNNKYRLQYEAGK